MSIYANRIKNKPRQLKAFHLSESTIKGLDKIRALFHSAYPEASHPTLSLVLEKVIVSQLQRLNDPQVMAVELEDYVRRYGAKLKETSKPRTSQVARRQEAREAARGTLVRNSQPK